MSATILTVIVLIVMWVVVLVPLLVRRAEDTDENATLWAPAVTETVGADARHDDAERDEADRYHNDSADHRDARPEARRAYADRDSSPRAGVLARRRRVLGVLALLVVATAGAAVAVSATLWLANAACDALLLGYVGRLRSDARRAASRPVQPRPVRRERTHVRSVAAQSARRPSYPIDLDDEDPYFAQLDIRYPRAANE